MVSPFVSQDDAKKATLLAMVKGYMKDHDERDGDRCGTDGTSTPSTPGAAASPADTDAPQDDNTRVDADN